MFFSNESIDWAFLINLFNLFTIDWTIPLLSIFSILISIFTLYITHLRGPNLIVAAKDKFLESYYKKTETISYHNYCNIWFEVRILFINNGIRPGILYEVDLSDPNNFVFFRIEPDPITKLPICIQPGESFELLVKYYYYYLDEKKFSFIFENEIKDQIQLTYYSSSSFIRNRKRKINISINGADILPKEVEKFRKHLELIKK